MLTEVTGAFVMKNMTNCPDTFVSIRQVSYLCFLTPPRMSSLS